MFTAKAIKDSILKFFLSSEHKTYTDSIVSSARIRNPLQRIHSILCDESSVRSLNHAKSFSSLTHDEMSSSSSSSRF